MPFAASSPPARRVGRGRPGPGTTAPSPRAWPADWTVAEALTRRERGRGLLGSDRLGPREGLWLPVRSVHTFGMRFALDLVWLARDGSVVRLDTAVGRGRIRTCLAARGGVVEVPAGTGRDLAGRLGIGGDGGPAAWPGAGERG